MELNIKEFLKFFNKHFNGNYNKAGRELKISPAQIYRIVQGKSKPGGKFFGKFIVYCKEIGENYEKYFFLPNVLHTVNRNKEAK